MSLTAYVVACLARTFDAFPKFNSFRKGSRLIVLDDLTISVLFEREIDGENVPEPVGIQAANRKTLRQINDELRAAQQHAGQRLGSATGFAWIRFIPGFLLRTFIRLASRNIGMQKRFGVVGVTAVGMFGSGPLWARAADERNRHRGRWRDREAHGARRWRPAGAGASLPDGLVRSRHRRRRTGCAFHEPFHGATVDWATSCVT